MILAANCVVRTNARLSTHFTQTEKIARRFHILESVRDGFLRASDAAEALGMTTRHVNRLLERVRTEGIAGLVDRRVGRPSNNRIRSEVRARIVEILNGDLKDYPPTHASEILNDEYEIEVSRETVRTIMIDEGLWLPKSKENKTRRVPQLRMRYPNLGDLIQFDGTYFEWLPGLGQLCLLVFIDDATSRLMHLALVENETSLDYLREWKAYIEMHGCPRRVLGDQHAAIFKTSKSPNQNSRAPDTDLSRALGSLGIHCWPSKVASGRGRVEREHQTLKGRLARELERRGIRTLEEANRYLPEYIERHNSNPNLTKEPSCDEDHHFRPALDLPLELVFTKRATCKVSSRLSVSLQGETMLLPDVPKTRVLANRRVMVARSPSGLATVLTDAGNFALRRPG